MSRRITWGLLAATAVVHVGFDGDPGGAEWGERYTWYASSVASARKGRKYTRIKDLRMKRQGEKVPCEQKSE